MEIFLAMRTWKHQTPVLYESRLVRVERAEQSDIVCDRTGRAKRGRPARFERRRSRVTAATCFLPLSA